MFHPFPFQGGTATLEGQAPSMNGQSRIPEAAVGQIPTGTIPGVNYATPTGFNPIGQIPVQSPIGYNPQVGAYGFNPYACGIPAGYGVPTAYNTPFVYNSAVNTPILNNPFAYGVNPYVAFNSGFGTTGFGVTGSPVGYPTQMASTFGYNPYTAMTNYMPNPFVNGFPTFNPTMGFNGLPTPTGYPVVNGIPVVSGIPNTFFSPVGLSGGQPHPFCFHNGFNPAVNPISTGCTTPFGTIGAPAFNNVNPFFAPTNFGTPTAFVNPAINPITGYSNPHFGQVNPLATGWNNPAGFPINGFNPSVPFGTFNPAWNLAATNWTGPVSTPWNNPIVSSPWLAHRTPWALNNWNGVGGWNGQTPWNNWNNGVTGWNTTPFNAFNGVMGVTSPFVTPGAVSVPTNYGTTTCI